MESFERQLSRLRDETDTSMCLWIKAEEAVDDDPDGDEYGDEEGDDNDDSGTGTEDHFGFDYEEKCGGTLVLDGRMLLHCSRHNLIAFAEAARSNATITRCRFELDCRHSTDDESGSRLLACVCAEVAQSIALLPSLTDISYKCKDQLQVRHLPIFLGRLRDIRTLVMDHYAASESMSEEIDVALRDHPNLESIRLISYSEGPVNCPLATCLSTLPKLKWVRLLQHHASKVQLRKFGRDNSSCSNLLHELMISGFMLDDAGTSALSRMIKFKKGLEVLEVGRCPCDVQFFCNVARSIQSWQTMEVLKLRREIAAHENDCFMQCLGMNYLLDGLRHGDCVQQLQMLVSPLTSQLSDSLVSKTFKSYMTKTTALEELTFRCDTCTWLPFCDGVGANSTLKTLEVWETDGCGILDNPMFLEGISSLLRIASLESFRFWSRLATEAEPELHISCIELLAGVNLRKFHFAACRSFSADEADRLIKALQDNYTLVKCPMVVSSSVSKDRADSIYKRIQILLTLNMFGRRYLVEDCKKVKGVALLSRVATARTCDVLYNGTDLTLDCMFFHLKENPSLCARQWHRLHKRRRQRQNVLVMPLIVVAEAANDTCP